MSMIRQAGKVSSIFLVLIILVGGYYTYQKFKLGVTGHVDIPRLDSSLTTETSINHAVDASNSYAFKQYHQYSEGDENMFFSPYSISTCLSMAYEGACGKTAEKIQSVFGWSEDELSRLTATSYLYNLLNDSENLCTVHTVNAVWMQQGYPFEEKYLSTVEECYGGEANTVDFARSEEVRVLINDWVEDRTMGKIQDMFSPNMIDEYTRMVLTNAIYFNGSWVKPFNYAMTRERSFNLSNNDPVTITMMGIKDKVFNYTETNDVQVVELPYVGKEYSMVIILPKENNLAEIEAKLTLAEYQCLIESLSEEKLLLSVPKFEFETKYKMNDNLAELGMPTAFTPSADFSGVSPTGELYISTVVHQAYVGVNEEGTEAAAATGVVYAMSMPSGIRFTAHHPFMFTIMERDTGLILFMGRVMDPS